MNVILDTGAFIALDKGNRDVAAQLTVALQDGDRLITSSGCVAQFWRGPRQVRAARFLNSVNERPLDSNVSRRIGLLLATTSRSDVVDAHLAMLAADGDVIVTSDPGDITEFVRARGVKVSIDVC